VGICANKNAIPANACLAWKQSQLSVVAGGPLPLQYVIRVRNSFLSVLEPVRLYSIVEGMNVLSVAAQEKRLLQSAKRQNGR